MNARTREEEYLRRMKALGYDPSLAGMDDDDIEWELGKMEEADRRREADWQQPVYRPVDPGLKARILRMFGQPHDESAIPKGQEFYLNGWDNGEDEPLQKKPAPGLYAPSRGGTKRPEESLNYWDTVLSGTGNGGARNWFQPASWVSRDVKTPTTPKPDFTFPLSPKNIIWREQDTMRRKNTPPDPLPEGTVITSNDAGSNAGMIEEAKNHPDVTDKLKAKMAEYEEKYKDIKNKPIHERLRDFYKLVDDGGVLDLKRQPGWGSPKFVYDGEVVNNDVPGNVLYGYLGKHFDIPDSLLYFGAGSNQIKNAIKAALKEGRNPLEVLKDFNLETFGDDPRDTARIRQGIDSWNKKYSPK